MKRKHILTIVVLILIVGILFAMWYTRPQALESRIPLPGSGDIVLSATVVGHDDTGQPVTENWSWEGRAESAEGQALFELLSSVDIRNRLLPASTETLSSHIMNLWIGGENYILQDNRLNDKYDVDEALGEGLIAFLKECGTKN